MKKPKFPLPKKTLKTEFEFIGYHFYTTDKRFPDLKDCETFQSISRYLCKSTIPSFNVYGEKKKWNYGNFMDAAGNPECDIFYCVETGKFYCPGNNELFHFVHPELEELTPNKEKLDNLPKQSYSTYLTVRIDYESNEELSDEDINELINDGDIVFLNNTEGITVTDCKICGIEI